MSMRPYQSGAIEEIKFNFSRKIKKVLLKLATGGGKTHIFSDVMMRTAENGKKCIMVVRGRQLVDQASKRLFHEKVNHGVLMANHWNKNPSAPIQICSIDTLITRQHFPEADLVVIDEAHLFTSDGCKEFISHYADKYILAVTATPYTKESMRHIADVVVNPITTLELIEKGYLVPPRYFAPSAPDLKGVRTQQGDYANIQLEERMGTLTGDIVNHWRSLGQNRPTVCFAVNINHSKTIVAQFNAAGIPAEHVEGDNTFQEREDAIKRLRDGKIKILSNVGILCTGVDMPWLGAIIMARPTKSYNLYIQQAGRGTRTHETKSDFILLDHAGNIIRHGFITDEPEVDLDGRVGEKNGPIPKTCKECFCVYVGNICHACGYSPPVAPSIDEEITVENGVLKELRGLPKGVEISIFIRRMKDKAKLKGYKYGWVYHQVREKYGEEVADAAFPGKARQRPESPWFQRSVRRGN